MVPPTVAFRAARDRLFVSHPSSPVPDADRGSFAGVPYWPHDPALRFTARLGNPHDLMRFLTKR